MGGGGSSAPAPAGEEEEGAGELPLFVAAPTASELGELAADEGGRGALALAPRSPSRSS